jgi:hypothetical protein
MAKDAASHLPTVLPSAEQPASSGRSLATVIDINVRQIGRKPQPQTLIGATAPEGWIRKIDRPREGKRSDIGLRNHTLNVFLEPRNPFEPGRMRRPKMEAIVFAMLTALVIIAVVAFTLAAPRP